MTYDNLNLLNDEYNKLSKSYVGLKDIVFSKKKLNTPKIVVMSVGAYSNLINNQKRKYTKKIDKKL